MQGNINDNVWVQLTKEGIAVHNEHYEEIAKYSNGLVKAKNYKPVITIYGYTKYQLWELAHIFGGVLYNGSVISPFKKNIIHYSDPSL